MFFSKKDLNPFTDDEQATKKVEDEEMTYVQEGSNEPLPFHVFDVFAQKYSPKEDSSLEEHTWYHWSPHQAYIYQKQNHKTEKYTNDRGGFLGLVKRLAKQNRKDINAMCSETERRLIFELLKFW